MLPQRSGVTQLAALGLVFLMSNGFPGINSYPVASNGLTYKLSQATASRQVPARTMERRQAYEPIGERQASEHPVEIRHAPYVPIEERQVSDHPIETRQASDHPIGTRQPSYALIGGRQASNQPTGVVRQVRATEEGGGLAGFLPKLPEGVTPTVMMGTFQMMAMPMPSGPDLANMFPALAKLIPTG